MRTVLITGANGYLGRFLVLEWARRLAPGGGRLICLVRGNDAEAAATRLERAFGTSDDLRHRYREAAGVVEVLAGDVGEPRLGLAERTWRQLADTVDLIVHSAAQVNHVLPYDQLFGPNVVGTAEVIRLALTTRIKPVAYVSTTAVLTGASTPDEDTDIRATCPSRRLDHGYANGYAAGKWAGEVLLHEAHDQFGLPATVFRSGTILAHRTYPGQLNPSDVLTRLLLCLLATGTAPGSFHRGRPQPHDGLPVDVTAAAIAAIGTQDGYRTYNVLNPHDDETSLDKVVDWLIEAGHPVQRIHDHGEWLARITTALRNLPEQQREHSLLPLLGAFAQPWDDTPRIPAKRFHSAVGENVPHLSAALVHKYVTDLHRLGLLVPRTEMRLHMDIDDKVSAGLRLLEDKDFTGFRAMCTSTATVWQNDGEGTRTIDEAMDRFASFAAAVESIRYDLVHQFHKPDEVIRQHVLRLVLVDGTDDEVHATAYFRFAGGLIDRIEEYAYPVPKELQPEGRPDLPVHPDQARRDQ